MLKRITAKFKGKCRATGKTINPGDIVDYDTSTRALYLASRTQDSARYVSDIFGINGKEYYRNKKGRCIDAPCCGCCTI